MNNKQSPSSSLPAQHQEHNSPPLMTTSSPSNFYTRLKHYSPLFPCCMSPSQSTDPIPISTEQIEEGQQNDENYVHFLVNRGWWRSFLCVGLMQGLILVVYLRFVFDDRQVGGEDYGMEDRGIGEGGSDNPSFTPTPSPHHFISLLTLTLTLLLTTLTFLLTQFLNPGIRDLSTIPQHQLTSATDIQYCPQCNHYKTQKFTHCFQCEVCVWNLDHHCGFFGKCIGGKAQFWAFVGFLGSVTLGFLGMLACVTVGLQVV